MAVCAALHCHNTYKKGFVLVRFPKDDVLREEWVSLMGRTGWMPNPNNRLCDVHFERDQWTKYRCRLKCGAIPTLFCNCGDVSSDSGTDGKSSSPHNHPCTKSNVANSTTVPNLLLEHNYTQTSTQPALSAPSSAKCVRSYTDSWTRKTQCLPSCVCKKPHLDSCVLSRKMNPDNNVLAPTVTHLQKDSSAMVLNVATMSFPEYVSNYNSSSDLFFALLDENVALKSEISKLKKQMSERSH